MVDQDQLTKWIVGYNGAAELDQKTAEFFDAARSAWPCVLAHTKREVSRRHFSESEATSLALEVWELVVRSVWSIFHREQNGDSQIENLENYLIGAFHHKLNRHLRQERRRDSILELLPPEELSLLGAGEIGHDAATRIHNEIQLDQVYATMDEDVRRAMIAKIYGFSWGEIAKALGTKEQNLIMRVQYAIRKVRSKFGEKRPSTK